MRFKRYCKCGATWTGNMPLVLGALLEKQWINNHTGEGHGECTARQASRARSRAEDLHFKELRERDELNLPPMVVDYVPYDVPEWRCVTRCSFDAYISR